MDFRGSNQQSSKHPTNLTILPLVKRHGTPRIPSAGFNGHSSTARIRKHLKFMVQRRHGDNDVSPQKQPVVTLVFSKAIYIYYTSYRFQPIFQTYPNQPTNQPTNQLTNQHILHQTYSNPCLAQVKMPLLRTDLDVGVVSRPSSNTNVGQQQTNLVRHRNFHRMKMKELYSSWHFMTFMNLTCGVNSNSPEV